ncbi:uncharacterized protein B0H64DRAFT_474003 [Chaetomium fimeti]|uniref:DUF676 domain-containing protein n=1 Tax=Chaetomium fimeti TaxID=1854472 RepID=A0AAE0HK74_9PEZI|nr:hypothetical protein B0H64DRAFT_474003 [Chaetomium fimeti]
MRRKQKQKQEKIFGIREIYCPPPPIQPEVDIVAVHGLNGSALGTWTTLDSGVCWLNDPQFLPKYVKNARVMVWGYNASFSSLTGHVPSNDRIHHHAHTLVANLAADRRLSGTADKPIIFLCHSLGGIVVKRALTYAQTRTAPNITHDHAIYTHTTAILFFGTPHHGTPKATWLHHLTKALAVATLHKLTPFHRPTSNLIPNLQLNSETLQNITDAFTPLTSQLRILYLWEMHPTPLLRDYVVPMASAVPPGDDEAERAGIAADHRGMVRFGDPAAQGFRVVVEALGRYCAEAGEVVRLRRGEAEGVLWGERRREVGEVLRGVGFGGGVEKLGMMVPDLVLGRVDERLEEWMGRTATLRSSGGSNKVKDEEW